MKGLSQTEGVNYEEICSNCQIHFYHDYYFTCFSDGDYIRWMYRLHSSVVEVYREQPQSFVIYGKESNGYRLSRQLAVDFTGSLELGSMTKREHEALLN